MPIDPTKFNAMLDDEQGTQARVASLSSQDIAPDSMARATELSNRTGAPALAVAANLPEFETNDAHDRMQEAASSDPRLGSWLSDPRRAALVRDDIDNTKGFAASVSRLWNSLKGPATQTVGGWMQSFGELNPWALAGDYLRATNATTYAPPGAIPSAAIQGDVASQQIAAKGADIADFGAATSAEGFRGLHHPTSFAEAIRNPRNTAEFYANMIAQSASAQLPSALLAPLGPEAALGGVAATTYGQQYAQDRAEGLDKAAALNDANFNAAFEVLGETLPFHYLFGKGQGSVGSRLARAYPTEMLSEAFTQAAQDQSSVANGGQPLSTNQRLANILDAMIASAGQITPVSAVTVAAHVAQQRADARDELKRKRTNDIITEFARYAQSADDSVQLSALADAARSMKLSTRSKEDTESLTEHLFGGQAPSLYIPASEFRTLFQNDAPRLAEQVTGNPNALAEAGETGDLVVPMSKYAAYLADKPQAKELEHVSRLRADGLSRKELESSDFAAAMDEANAVKPEEEQHRSEVQGIVDGVHRALVGTGAYSDGDAMLQAKIVGRMFGVMAKNSGTGLSPQQLADRYNITIGGVPISQASQSRPQPAEQRAPINPEPTPGEPGALEHKVEGNPVIELPLEGLALSKDVPQFKAGADEETGVVEPLGGKFDRRGVGPIQVWRRNDGRMEIISGRHRVDLARRSGETTIPAQVYDEANGFTADQAAILDAELNIRDGQGKVKDYVQYFRSGITEEEADARGLLARSTGRRAFIIATDGTSELIAAHSADRVSDEAAVQVAQAAPNNDALQNLGLKLLADGKSISVAANTMRAARAMGGDKVENGDLFGFDDSAIQDAIKMAQVASRRQRELGERLSAVRGAAKRPDVARREGVDIKDPGALQRRVQELEAERKAWENWHSNPELTNSIRSELHMAPLELQSPPEPAPEPAPAANEDQGGLFAPPTIDELTRRAAQEKDAQRNGLGHDLVPASSGDGELFAGGRPEQRSLNQASSVDAELASLRAQTEALTGRAKEIADSIPEFPGLRPEQRVVEMRARLQVALDPEKAVADYRALPGTQGGRVISTDEAREIFPDYATSADHRSDNAVAVHEPSSWVAKEVWRQELARPVSPGREPRVVFTSGGTGAGKTSGRSRLSEVKELVDEKADIIYDGNLQSVPSAESKFEQATATGRDVLVLYTGRDIHEAMFHGAIPRAENPAYGRTVPLAIHVDTHLGAAKTYLELKAKLEGNPRFTFRAIHNSYVKGQQSEVRDHFPDEEIASIANADRATILKGLKEGLDEAYRQGQVGDRVYFGTLGLARPNQGPSPSVVGGEAGNGSFGGEVRPGDQGPGQKVLNQNPAAGGVPFSESAYRPEVTAWAKARFGDLVAPNGRPAWQNFVAWFGDSKVVDAEGKPLVVYHGTVGTFDQFITDDGTEGAAFFTVDGSVAGQFAITNAEATGEEGPGFEPNTVPVYLSIKNPLVLNAADVMRDGIHNFDAMRAAVERAKADGHDGLHIKNVPEFEGFPAADQWAAFHPEQIKSATANAGNFDAADTRLLSQGGGKRPNAQILFADGERAVAINLFESANKSSFFHEAAHLFLEIMGDLAAEPTAAKQFRDDYAAIRKFVGAADGKALTDEQHETFARSFELYLRTGKAPAPELVRPMARIARWLTSIYRDVKDLIAQGAKPLDPEISAVMDRMLAVDDEIAAMEDRQSHVPMLPMEEFTKLGFTDDQWHAYVAALDAATDEARARVTAAAVSAFEREKRAEWKAEARKVREGLEAALEETPAFKAWRALQAGDKLDLNALKDRYANGNALQLLRGLNVARLEGGVHPDLAAEALGFRSGDELVKALLGVREAQARIAAQTEAAMQAKHPDPASPAELRTRVSKALYGSKRLTALEVELGWLAKLAGQPAPPVRVLGAYARQAIGKITLRRLRPNDYLVNERRAAREAMQAIAKGNFALALRHKRDQALQAALYGEARRAQTAADRQARMLRRAGKAATLKRVGKAGKPYVDALRALLAGHELTKVTGKTVVRRDALREWVRKTQESGANTAVSDDLLARVEAERVTNIADLTLGQLADLHEAVKNLLHLAAVKNRLLTARGEMEWDDAKAALKDRLAKQPVRHNGGSDNAAINALKNLADAYAEGSNWVLQPETLVEWLDDGTEGPWHDLLWEPSETAEHAREALHNKIGALLKAAIDALPTADRKALDDRYFIASLNENVTGHYIISALLNMGNAGNRDKLMRGGRVVGDNIEQFTPDQLAEMFRQLTAAHAKLAQDVLDAVNALWPDIVAMEEAVSGFAPPKVEAAPFVVVTKDGMVPMRGGYFPAVYDPRGAKAGRFSEDEQAMKLLAGQTPIRASTSKGHLEARTDYAAPLLLDWHAVLTRHLDGVMSDITHRRFLAQAYRILGDVELSRMIDNRFGRGVTRGLRTSMERAAVGNAGLLGPMAQYLGPFTNVANSTMTNIASAALGLRVPLALANTVTAPILATARVQKRFLIKGFLAYYGNMRKQAETIRRMSPMMAQRAKARSTELHAMLNTLRGKRGARKRMIEFSMAVHQWIVPLAENAIWLSAYMQSHAGGADIVEATRMADKAIRQTQTKHTAKDLSNAEGGWMRPLMLFAGPMVVINNRLQEAGLRGLRGSVHSPTQALGAWVAMAAGGSLLFELLMGRGPGDEDDDGDKGDIADWLEWCGKKLLLMPFSAFPVLRDVAAHIDSGYSHGNPLVEAGDRLYKFGKNVVQSGVDLFEGNDIDKEKLVGSGLDAAGVATGVPSTQLKRTGTDLMGVATGQRTPENPAKEAYYLLQGPPKDE